LKKNFALSNISSMFRRGYADLHPGTCAILIDPEEPLPHPEHFLQQIHKKWVNSITSMITVKPPCRQWLFAAIDTR